MMTEKLFKVSPKKSSYVVESPNVKAEIPSKDYPLHMGFNTKVKIFGEHNTKEITEEKILAIINRQKPQVGYCYSNVEKFVEDCRAEGIAVHQYTGWIFVGTSDKLIHHSWAVLNGKHIIDLSIDFGDVDLLLELHQSNPNATLDEVRERIVEHRIARESLPLTERGVTGVCHPFYLYVGTRSTAQQGKDIYNSLKRKVNPMGTPTQQLYFKQKSELG